MQYKIVFLTYGDFLSPGMGKRIENNQDQSSIMLFVEHNFKHNAVVLRVTLKSVTLKFSSKMYLMYLTLLTTFLTLQHPKKEEK